MLTLLPGMDNQRRITALAEEMASIHLANLAYWRQPEASRGDRAEYQARVGRLGEIRQELSELRGRMTGPMPSLLA
jgi:hypothetical protein